METYSEIVTRKTEVYIKINVTAQVLIESEYASENSDGNENQTVIDGTLSYDMELQDEDMDVIREISEDENAIRAAINAALERI